MDESAIGFTKKANISLHSLKTILSLGGSLCRINYYIKM